MPYDNYRWLKEAEIKNLIERLESGGKSFMGEDEESSLLEVDLEYPPWLHKSHSSFPLAAVNKEINFEDLSPFSQDVVEELTGSRRHKAKKLTATMETREKYLCHVRNLQFYLENGLKLTKVHRVMGFRQKSWMRGYIEKCTEMRAKSLTKAESNVWKGLVNSVFGKMIENSEKRMDVHFVTSAKEAAKRFSDPTLTAATICSPELVVCLHKKKKIYLSQSFAVGAAILELSKLKMLERYYYNIKPRFPGRVSMLMSDTDSLLCLIGVSSVREAMERMVDFMDTSNYPPEDNLFNKASKNCLNKMKNETPGDIITAFAAARAKSYCLQTAKGKTHRRAKGVKKVFGNFLKFEDFVKVIETVCRLRLSQHNLLSKDHVVKLVKQDRSAFSSLEDKRYWLCNLHSVPYGSILALLFKRNRKCPFCEDLEYVFDYFEEDDRSFEEDKERIESEWYSDYYDLLEKTLFNM